MEKVNNQRKEVVKPPTTREDAITIKTVLKIIKNPVTMIEDRATTTEEGTKIECHRVVMNAKEVIVTIAGTEIVIVTAIVAGKNEGTEIVNVIIIVVARGTIAPRIDIATKNPHPITRRVNERDQDQDREREISRITIDR